MIVDVPAFVFPLDAGPATASLEFVTGVIGRRCSQAAWAMLESEPRWIELEERTPPSN